MDQPQIIQCLPVFLKYGTFLNTWTKRLYGTVVFTRILLTAGLMVYIGSTMTKEVIRNKTFAKTHDFLICVIMILYELDFVRNKAQVLGIIEFLLQPFPKYPQGDPHQEEIENYVREVRRSGRFITALALISCCWAISPLAPLLLYPGTAVYETFHIPMASIVTSESYIANAFAIIISTVLLLSGVLHFYAWYPLILYSVLKIKLMVRLMVVDFTTLDAKVERQANDVLGVMVFLPLCIRCRVARQVCWTAPRTEVGICCRNACKELISHDCLQLYLCRTVDAHLQIIRLVRLVDECFHRSVMVYNKAAVLAAVVFIPKISFHQRATQYLNSGFEVLGALACIGIFNWCGQQILNESDALYRALYGTSWADKPPKVRKHLLMMMTMATRPLRLTAGSIYTLSMELYFSILNATYSYASLLQSVKD